MPLKGFPSMLQAPSYFLARSPVYFCSMNSISSLRPHLKPLQGNYSKTYNSSQIWSSGKIAHLQMRKLIGCSMASMDKISRPESGQVKIPCVLTVAGSDSGAGAGIQADMKTCAALGVYCCTAITSVTAQNTLGVQGIHLLPADFVTRQMESVLSDISVDVVKTGMLPTEKIIRGVSATLRSHNFRAIVVDPVMVATSGDVLAGPAILDALRTELFPLADLVTPNLLEASRLIGGRPVTKLSDMKEAAAIIKNMGPRYVLVKGGHLEDRDDPVDILYDGQAWHELRGTRIQTRNTHGTGCTLASSIAAQIAKGAEILPAVSAAKAYIEETLKHSTNILIGKGQHGPLDHSYLLIENPVGQFDAKTLFLYAVTDSSMNMRWCRSTPEAVQAAIEGGATIVQLRQKEAETLDFLQDAEACVKVARSYGVPLLINDRVDVALACDADGVHLGQSDMPVKKARLFLGPKKIIGLSCKTPDQAYVAWRDGADYVGCGGVYPTNTKKDNKTIGLQGLYEVCKTSRLPVVAIGGISKSNVHEVMHSRPDKLCGVAVVSALFDQPDVHEATREILASLKLAVK